MYHCSVIKVPIGSRRNFYKITSRLCFVKHFFKIFSIFFDVPFKKHRVSGGVLFIITEVLTKIKHFF